MSIEMNGRHRRIAADLRAIAERDAALPPTDEIKAELDALKLFQELQVHQIELEMQHEELDRNSAQVTFLLREFTDLYDFAPVGYFTISRGGIILRGNLAAAAMAGKQRSTLAGLPLRRLIAAESRPIFARFLAGLDRAQGDHTCVVSLARPDLVPMSVQINAVSANDTAESFRLTMTDVTERQKLQRQHSAQSERIRELSHRLVSIQEAERHALSNELHDRTSGNLAALDLMLKSLSERLPPDLATALGPDLDDIKGLLLETTHSIRDISSSIHPPLLHHCGMVPALEDFVARFRRRTGIAVEFSAMLTRDIGSELESTLFRITQEALTNCAKHSQARFIKVCIKNPADKLVLTITDDGHGFPQKSLFAPDAEPGQGLISMKERTEFLGGRFDLRSRPGKGTRITVSFGLRHERRQTGWSERRRERRRQAMAAEASE